MKTHKNLVDGLFQQLWVYLLTEHTAANHSQAADVCSEEDLRLLTVKTFIRKKFQYSENVI